MDLVCARLNLVEKDYFGLRFLDECKISVRFFCMKSIGMHRQILMTPVWKLTEWPWIAGVDQSTLCLLIGNYITQYFSGVCLSMQGHKNWSLGGHTCTGQFLYQNMSVNFTWPMIEKGNYKFSRSKIIPLGKLKLFGPKLVKQSIILPWFTVVENHSYL